MGTELLPEHIREFYEVHEWKHACAILQSDFTNKWNDLIAVLENFKLSKTWIMTSGGCPVLVFGITNKLYDKDC
jgi:hypothetical protein